jgi:glycosyltransferase involved in cell wall biosynthesis
VALSEFGAHELVIVDDASTDGSVAVIEAELASHPWLPALLVARGRNRGLAAARNLAARHARGDYVFVLDADNFVYPHALARLTDALDRDPGASFAYGILEVFSSRGPTDLKSWLDWDPERLRYGNFVDAMAMIRRSALEEAGGYSSDARLYGWEDFALWCALADRGQRGVLVPEIIAAYRSSIGSMIALTDIDASAAWSALLERYPILHG